LINFQGIFKDAHNMAAMVATAPTTSLLEMECIVIGDLHWDSLNRFYETNGNDQIKACVDQALDYAKENGIKTVIQTGDIFDSSNPTQQSISDLLGYFLHHSGLNFHFILGNHDFSSDAQHSSHLIDFLANKKLTPNLQIFEKETQVKIEGVPFVFCSHPNVKTKPTKYPTVNILHVDVVGSKFETSGRVVSKGIKLEDSSDFNIIGHNHKLQSIGKRTIYPGMLYSKIYTKENDFNKGFLHCTIKWSKTKLIVKHKFIPIKLPFKLHTLVINELQDLGQIKPPTVGKFETNFYKLFVPSDFVLPDDFLVEHPNITDHPFRFKSKGELKALQEGDSNIQLDEVRLADSSEVVVRNLDTFLLSKGFDDERVLKGTQIIQNIIAEIRQAEL